VDHAQREAAPVDTVVARNAVKLVIDGGVQGIGLGALAEVVVEAHGPGGAVAFEILTQAAGQVADVVDGQFKSENPINRSV
jgi:N-acetylglucosamine kinase-like BadF-type ATPase